RAPDDREVRARAGGVDECANRVPAPLRGGRVERASLDVALERRERRRLRFAVPADQGEIATSAQKAPRRVRNAPGGGDRRHLEIVAHDEAVEAQASPQQARDDRG